MPRTYGRIEYGSRAKVWRVIAYRRNGSEQKLGEYDTREEAVKRLRSFVDMVHNGTAYGVKS